MYYIADVTGYKGDLGTAERLEVIEEAAVFEETPALYQLMTLGFTIKKEELIEEIKGTNVLSKEIKRELLELVRSCEEIVIITTNQS
jgi:hypothetical protein